MKFAEFGIGLRRGGKRSPVGFRSAVCLHHLLADHELVITLGVVEHIADLMLIDPAEFAVKQRIVGIVVQRLVTDQLNAALNPAPAIDRRRKRHGNIVSHIPREIRRRTRKFRLQLGNPRRQLNHFKVFPLLLKSVHAEPEHIGKHSPESAERNRGECHHRRQSLNAGFVNQLVLLDDRIQTLLNKRRRRQQNGKRGNREKPYFESSEIHLAYLLTAARESSRRL